MCWPLGCSGFVAKIRGNLPMAWDGGQRDPRDDPKEGEEGQAGNRQVVKPESVKNVNLSSTWGVRTCSKIPQVRWSQVKKAKNPCSASLYLAEYKLLHSRNHPEQPEKLLLLPGSADLVKIGSVLGTLATFWAFFGLFWPFSGLNKVKSFMSKV
ncbi:hypothetical protein B0H14DRAFT_3128713 [Mycena olivaceomarginata]|nr:hypothetical protein B0H14DRAFT_3128713 [Mycena olivaceomarginata]